MCVCEIAEGACEGGAERELLIDELKHAFLLAPLLFLAEHGGVVMLDDFLHSSPKSEDRSGGELGFLLELGGDSALSFLPHALEAAVAFGAVSGHFGGEFCFIFEV